MPQLWCGLENVGHTNKGRMKGSVNFTLPSECYMAQLFDPEL